MGTEYYLVREDNNTRFELGKGLVNEAFEHLAETAQLPSADYLTEAIVDAMGSIDNCISDYPYARFVAERVQVWAGGQPVRFCDEHEIESFEERPPITGSRYREDEYVPSDVGGSGQKNDSEKIRYDLVPPAPLAELASIYTMGARKYSDWNWAKGMAWSRVYAALMRHVQAWWQEEERDQEDGQLHLGSVAWCAFTLMEYERLGVGKDDRVHKDV